MTFARKDDETVACETCGEVVLVSLYWTHRHCASCKKTFSIRGYRDRRTHCPDCRPGGQATTREA